jgi:hypothetical protein
MKNKLLLILGLSLIILAPSCNKSNPVSVAPVNPYSLFFGIWKAPMQAGGQPGHFTLLLNSDTSFSFSQVMDSSGAVSLSQSGYYSLSGPNMTNEYSATESSTLYLFNATYKGYYQFKAGPLNASRTWIECTWVSGHDFMNATTPATTMWAFSKQ